jgi:NAD(P)H dehydrogenase (quinone)
MKKLSDVLYCFVFFIPGIRHVQLKLNQLTSYVPPPRPKASSNKKHEILLIHSHPCPDSFNAAIAQTFIDSATKAGHEVRQISLYDHSTDPTKCYRPNLSRLEREHYYSFCNNNMNEDGKKNTYELDQEVKDHIRLLQWCDTLVLVYPTWWLNTPASLKGFFDRTLLPGLTWESSSSMKSSTTDTAGVSGIVPKLNNIEHIIGISTYGAHSMLVLLGGDNGRQMISSAIRHCICPNASLVWKGLYGADSSTLKQRQDFLKEVATLSNGKYF